MKKNLFTKLWLRVGMIVAIMTTALSGTVWADEVLYYTLDGTTTGGDNGYATESSITQNEIGWKVTGNTTMSPWRIGGKSLSGVDRPVYSTTAMGSAITKVELEVGAASSITVNSLKLVVASDAEFSTTIDQVTADFTANSTITFEPTSGTEWATGAYYKFVFNVTVSGSSNKFVEFKNAKFYYDNSGSSVKPIPTITVSSPVDALGQAMSTLYVNENFYVTVTTTSDAPITYTSDANELYVRTWNTETGKMCLIPHVDGQVSITYSVAETDKYAAAEKTETFTIVKTSTTCEIIVPEGFNNNIANGTTAGKLKGQIQGITSYNSQSENSEIASLFTWTSSNTDVATIAADGTVTLVSAGTTTITCIFAGDATYAASSITYSLSVINGEYVQPTTVEANLNNSLFGTNYTGSVNGLTDENALSGTIDNVTVTYGGSGYHYVNNTQIRFYPNNKLTFAAPAGYVITQIVFTPASNTWAAEISSDNGTYTADEKTWTGSATSVLFTGSGSSRCEMSKATLTLAQVSSTPSTISEVRAQGTGSVWTQGVVTSVNGKTAYIQDSDAAIVVYGSENLTCVVGDEIEVRGTLTTFNGLLEIQSPTITVLSQNNTVTPEVMTIAQVNASTKQGWLVKIENAVVSAISDQNVTVSQGENSVVVRFNSAEDITCAVGDAITLNGNIGCFNTVQIANPTNVVVSTEQVEPTIVVGDASVAYGSTFTVDSSVIEGGDITVTSGNTAVATVNGLVITPAAVGTTTITVATAETNHYNAGSETFTLTVTAPAGQTTAPTASVGEVLFVETFTDCEGEGGNSDGFATADNTEITSPNNYTDNDGWSFTKGYQADGCVKFGGSKAAGSATTPDITATIGKTYTLTFKAAPWSTESATMNVTATNAEISGLSEDAMTAGEWNEFTVTVTPTAASFNLTFEASKNRFFLDEVKIEAPAAEVPAITYTIPPSGLGTFCSEYPLDLSALPEGVKAYTVTSFTTTSVKLTQITSAVKGGTGLVIEGTGGTDVEFESVDCSTVPENELVGTLAPTYLAANTVYGLKSGQFHPNNAGVINAHRAYLPAENGNAVKVLVIEFDDATGITHTRTITDEETIYDLMGRRLNKVQKGINIVNGKKVLK